MAQRKPKLLSINPGCGVHLTSYITNGINVNYAIEPKLLERQCLYDNLGLSASDLPANKIYNRKQRGVDELLAQLKLKAVGDLDVLEINTTATQKIGNKRDENLFDVFGLARRLLPKIVVALAPAEICATKNRWEFEGFLDYLRYSSLSKKDERQYLVDFGTIDTADYGSPVRKQFTFIIGLRTDVAKANNISTEYGLRFAFPKKSKAKTFADALKNHQLTNEEDDFWFIQTSKNQRFRKAIDLLPVGNERTEIRRLTPKEKLDCGYSKTSTVDLALTGLQDFVPDTSKYNVIHPTHQRLLSVSELRCLFDVPKDWKNIGTSVEFAETLSRAIPPTFTKSLTNTLIKPALAGKLKIPKSKSGITGKIEAAELLRIESDDIRTYSVDLDRGFEASTKQMGKEPRLADFDYLFDANEIGEDFVVYAPFDDNTGERPIVGTIRRKVFKDEARVEAVRQLSKLTKSKTGRSDARGNVAPNAYTDEEIEKEKQTYGADNVWVSDDKRRMKHIKSDGEWSRPRTPAIPSIQVGWNRDTKSEVAKGRGRIKRTSVFQNEKICDAQYWNDFNDKVDNTYRKMAFDSYRKQRGFMNAWIPKSVRLGSSLFTTMSIQAYTADDMPSMLYHVDSGDENSGLTNITAFEEGEYRGGYFVLPRWRCAFKIGDGDVFIANSNEVHGVTPAETDGTRYSIVSYVQPNLASNTQFNRAYPPKSPRPNFNIRQWEVAIPSKDRSERIVNESLATLARYKVPPKKVTVFVADEEQRKQYADAIAKAQLPYNQLVVALPGVREVREFATAYYPENTPVLFMDDDIEEVLIFGGDEFGGAKYEPATNLYEQIVVRGFNTARENNAYLWGIYAATDEKKASQTVGVNVDELTGAEADAFRFERVSVGNYYIIGSFFGQIIRHDKSLSITTPKVPKDPNGLFIGDKEDHERSVLHYIKDGRVVRLDYASVKTKYYSGSAGVTGGLEFQRSLDTIKEGAEYMVRTYPKYVRAELRTRGEDKGKWEIRHK